jgi:hypothetical protein
MVDGLIAIKHGAWSADHGLERRNLEREKKKEGFLVSDL